MLVLLPSLLSPQLRSLLPVLTRRYTAAAELRAAYDLNPDAPTITDAQLGQVLFRCVDQAGGIVGNSYCIVNCAVIGDDTANDMCTM
ncbi:hypothetical protein TgHK011_009323 [Trichoderma gracile]|nr:hypothetical protein TgHK011_009323 [Trichoderma gracile]